MIREQEFHGGVLEEGGLALEELELGTAEGGDPVGVAGVEAGGEVDEVPEGGTIGDGADEEGAIHGAGGTSAATAGPAWLNSFISQRDLTRCWMSSLEWAAVGMARSMEVPMGTAG